MYKRQSIHKALAGAVLETVESGKGVKLVSVASGSDAYVAGLRAGDVIVAANKVRIANVEQLVEVGKRSSGNMLLRILRGSSAFYVILR